MKDFVDHQCNETTNNESDRVSKDEFMYLYFMLEFKLKQVLEG